MKAIAWVVEILVDPGQWEPANIYPTRDRARRKARNMSAKMWRDRVRVRQYVRAEKRK